MYAKTKIVHGYTYSVDIVLESVVVYKNRGNGIYIASNAVNVSTYNLTINNSHITHSNGTGLIITTIQIITTTPSTSIAPLYDSLWENQAIVIVNSNFTYNHQSKAVIKIAIKGIQYTISVTIESTEISHNTPYNHGLFLSSRTIYRTDSHFKVSLLNVIVNNNSICPMSSDTDELKSAMHGVFVNNLMLNNVSIINNNMTGLSVYHTAVQVNGASVFHNNTGIVGGGLAMYGDSYLKFEHNSVLNFTNNSAAVFGGAISVETSYLLSESVCFFQYSIANSEAKLQPMAFFSGNKADIAGSVLFGGDIHRCYLYSYDSLSSINQSQYFYGTFEYSTQSGSSVISSASIDVCFCDDDKINCSKKFLSKKAYPGKKINISIATVGQENGIVPGIVYFNDLPQKNYPTIAKKCSTIEFTAKNNTNYSLYYDLQQSEKITMEPCPVGFGPLNETCDCEKQLHKIENIKCIAANNTITQPGDNWISSINDCAVAFSPCPFDYCKTAQVNFHLTYPDAQCALNRSGTLCGGCKKDYSLALGSNNCIKCDNAKSIVLIIPFAVAGFCLVALLMVLNLTVSIGTISTDQFIGS